jgi:hypothetical protein
VVSISLETNTITYDQLLHTSDLAIRNLLNDPIDPMAMAAYLWVYIQRKPAITSGDQLVHWGTAWVRRIILEGKVSRRRDEDISSAALVVASLINIPSFLGIKAEVTRKVEQLIAHELERALIPFRQPSYGTIVLLTAHMLGINNPKFKDATLAINRIYTDSIHTGRSFGFSFAAKLIEATANKDSIKELVDKIESALIDPATSYEDQVYLLQALWELRSHTSSARLLENTESLISRIPSWTYHSTQVRGLIEAGEELAAPESHLYRASLLDIITQYQGRSALYEGEKFQARYSGRRGIGFLAFGFLALVSSLLIGSLGIYIYWQKTAARHFWISGEYAAMASSSALLYLASVLLISYLLLIAPVILWKTFSLLVVSSIQSDQKLKDILLRPVIKVSLAWFTIIFLGIVVGIITGILTQGVQHMFK